MVLGRRKLLGFLALSPVAAKKVAEKTAADLSGIPLTGHGNWAQGSDVPSVDVQAGTTRAQWRAILANASQRRELESIFFEDERRVGFIDPDLAVKRSFSLSAKITFQRQRNVERRIEALHKEWPWQRVESLAKKFLGIFA